MNAAPEPERDERGYPPIKYFRRAVPGRDLDETVDDLMKLMGEVSGKIPLRPDTLIGRRIWIDREPDAEEDDGSGC